MKKDIVRSFISGIFSSLIASGIIYFFTKEWLWNYNLPLWIWLSITVGIYLIYKLILYIIFKSRLNNIISEYKEGTIGDSFPYTWEYKKSKGPYSIYGYEPYNIKIKEETKESLSKPNTYVRGHDVREEALKRFIQVQIVWMMNKNLQAYLLPTLEYLNYTQDSQKHEILY